MTARKIPREQALLELESPSTEISKSVLGQSVITVSTPEQAIELFGYTDLGLGAAAMLRRERAPLCTIPAEPMSNASELEFENPDPSRKKRAYRPRKGSLGLLIQEAQLRVKAKQWDGPIGDFGEPEPRVLVGLYAASHEHVYKTKPEELSDPKMFMAACSMARRFAADVGSLRIAVEIVRWTWSREHAREKKDPDRDFRVSFRYQFSKTIVTDFKRANRPRG